MNPNDIPGTGDYFHTPPTGHPLDPRTDDEPDADDIDYQRMEDDYKADKAFWSDEE